MSKRLIRNVKGFVHDIDQIKALSSDYTNIRLLSDRSLYILQNLSSLDVTFLSRYGTITENDTYIPVTPGSPDNLVVDTAIDLIRRDLTNMTVEDTLQCICDTLQDLAVVLAETGSVSAGACGSQVDPEGLPVPPVGPGEPWPDLPAYDAYKCRGANWLLDGLIDLLNKLRLWDVDFWTSTTVGGASGLITEILLSTLIGGPLTLIAGAVIGIATALIIGATIDLNDIHSVLVSARSGLICALYSGGDTDASKSAFLDELGDQGLNVAEVGLLGLILTHSVINKLYEYDSEVDAHPETTSCAACAPSDCAFIFQYGSGTFRYDGQDFVLSSEPALGFHLLNVWVDCNAGSCQNNWCIEFVAHTIALGGTWNRQFFNFIDTNCNWSPPSDFPGGFPAFGNPVLLNGFQLTWNQPFSVTLNIKPGLRPLGDGTPPYSGSNNCV